MSLRDQTALRMGVCQAGCVPILILMLPFGCAPDRIDPGAESAVSDALGLTHPIEFRIEGGPVDEVREESSALPLGDAVRFAAMTDPGLQAALARVRIACADADQARLLPNPVLDFVLRWNAGAPQIEVSLAQDLIQALRRPHLSSAADKRIRESAADAMTVAIDLVAEVHERYVTVQTLESLVPILSERRELLDRLITTAEARLDAQEGTRGDVITLQAQRIELDVEIADVHRELGEARLRLTRLIGEPSGAAGWRLDPWEPPSAALTAVSEAGWIEAGLRSRPEVQAATWALAALGDEAALTRLLPWDGLGVGISAERDGEWSAGPSVTAPVPVLDTGQAGQARVMAEQIEAQHHLTLIRRAVVEDVRVAFQSLTANVANLKRIESELIPLQQQRRQQAEDAYRAGLTDVTALFLAEQDLRAAHARAIEVERQVSVALIRLQRAAGGPGVSRSLGEHAEQFTPTAPTFSGELSHTGPTHSTPHLSNR